MLLGSGNAHKVQELRELLEPLSVRPLLPGDLARQPPPPPEEGATFEENAHAKALAYARAAGMWALADDSGLEVAALGGRPGVHSSRFAGPDASDAENNARLLRELAGVPLEERQARYVAVIVLASPGAVLLEARGECRGVVIEEPRGHGGFGYDPLFLVPGTGRTFAELGPAEKSRISHRGAALRRLARELGRMLSES